MSNHDNVIRFPGGSLAKPVIVSRAQATQISNAVYAMMRNLETRGIERSATAAAMVGMGAAIVAEREGAETLFKMLDNARAQVEGDKAPKN